LKIRLLKCGRGTMRKKILIGFGKRFTAYN